MTVATSCAISPPIGGPRLLGVSTNVALGAYTEITQLIAPASVVVGKRATVQVIVKNLHNISIYIAVTGVYDTAELYSDPEYAAVGPGATRTFTISFTMPSRDVRVLAFSHYWTGTAWYYDDQKYTDIVMGIGWIKLDTRIITITPIEAPTGWVKLDTRMITLTPVEAPIGWIKLDTRIITLTPVVVPPPLPPIPPEEEKKFPWAPVLIGGGAIIATVGLLSMSKRKIK